MTSEERDIITRFILRIAGVESGGSVPATPPLPPIDPEADALIAELFNRYPAARYRMTQTAFVQEQALIEAQNRIRELQWRLEQAERRIHELEQQLAAGGAPAAGRSGGFFSGLFGGRSASSGATRGAGYGSYAPPPPPPQYQPTVPPAMLRPGGSGFLGSALSTAAGVAGGMLLGNALLDLFSSHHGGEGGGFGGGGGFAPSPWGGGEAPAAPAANPWDDVTNQPGPTQPDLGSAGFDDAVNTPDAGGFDDSLSDPGLDTGFDDDGPSFDDI
jgi:hypothetical protein